MLEFKNNRAIIIFIFVFSLTFYGKSNAQPKHITPELIEAFVKFIEQNTMPITDYLSNAKDLSTFVKTLQLADEFKTLEGEGEFTILAPTNQAFEQFPTDVIKELFQPKNKEKLRSIVTYHIIKGKLKASDIVDAIAKNKGEAKFKTLNGLDLTAYADEGDLFIKDDNGYSIKIIQQDILQSNGMVYMIDTVILPQVDNEFEKQTQN